MDWSQADIANGLAALINGYRQGAKEARDSAMQGQEFDLKQAQEARAMQELAMKQEKDKADIAYMNALGQRAMRENNMSPEGSRFLASKIGMPYTEGQYFSNAEAVNLINAYNQKKEFSWKIEEARLRKEIEKKAEKEKKELTSEFIKREKYLAELVRRHESDYQTLMGDPDKQAKALYQMESTQRELDNLRANARAMGLNVFANWTSPPTPKPAQNNHNQPGFFERAMGFLK